MTGNVTEEYLRHVAATRSDSMKTAREKKKKKKRPPVAAKVI